MNYKITIEELSEKEVEKSEYKVIGKKENGEDDYGYVKTGEKGIEVDEKVIYVQEKRDLDVAELAIYINRAR